ncbi:MAG TPA: hypothetical protein VFA69_03380 [Candidatus Nitrosotalea sp.]|nr:hypothetical protein [Candidatus Nitrosotalea sp.]
MHTIDRNQLQTTLSLIKHDEMGFFTDGKFAELSSLIQLETSKGREFNQLYRLTHYIYQDVQNLLTIISRLEWQKNLVLENKLDDGLWSYFVATDIYVFHSELRSIFDYIAKIIQLISNTSGKTKSFEKLKNWMSKPENEGKISKDLSDFVSNCRWFYDIRKIRNNLIHDGAEPLVFPNKDRILFLIRTSDYKKIIIPEIMFNENVVDFELYAGLYMAYIMIYLEEFSELINRHLNLNKFRAMAKGYHPGLRITQEWINKILVYKPGT